MKKNEIKTKAFKKSQAFGLFLNKYAGRIAVCMMACIAMGSVVFAAPTAEVMWTTIWGEIVKWVLRLGGAIVVYGGIMVGLGFRHNDAAQKTDGFNTIVAGGIVAAVAGMATLFVS